MPDTWKSYRGAPDAGTVLCKAGELSDGVVVSLETNGFPILLIRSIDVLRAYVNACPHQFLPFDFQGNRLLSEDGRVIRCSNHGAGFSVATGEGIEGLGIGECLDRIAVEIAGDVVVISG
jgi:nitrite reductase/ring-hydroxylating ferredoxin subunit